MKERPILFNAEMVRAVLDGRKTQTRRLVKLSEFSASDTPGYDFHFLGTRRGGKGYLWQDMTIQQIMNLCPFGQGSRLWVREAWRASSAHDNLPPREIPIGDAIEYLADDSISHLTGKKRHSMFMPRWACRITLEITDVRLHRLQEISESDAMDEGAGATGPLHAEWDGDPDKYRKRFRELWDSINTKPSPFRFCSNPWVWAVSFEVVRG